ncbi:nucleotidyltransferase family protein [Methanoplanus sp. FWC-SCC4]|uniref:protein adenylyltransferase n=1 Tax=Methanochimaera problematica TaxID=2609417 RepID=A0AA97FBD3_9EURY|nr:nucleotidyltransferase family protein [Methanoplanus sp. FWC-SCC4]WOF15437.1 nucleotidyltransferase family protein [Methanoplanus sp. FWC-SCC4]
MNSDKYSYKKTERKEELDTIVATLNKNYTRLSQKYKISEISVIGSYARGEQTENSDLDIMVDFFEPVGWEVVDLRDELEELLKLKIDLVLKAGVIQRKRVYDGILEDIVYVKA